MFSIILFYSIQFNYILFYSITHFSILFFSVLFYSILPPILVWAVPARLYQQLHFVTGSKFYRDQNL